MSFPEETRRAREFLAGAQPALPWRRLRSLIAERVPQLTEAVRRDIGRPPGEVLATDILPFADAVRFMERRARRILAPRRIRGRDTPIWLFPSRDTVYRQPWGIVGIIGTWNYPIMLNGVQIVQALAAGNAVLWKPSELTSLLADELRRLFLDAGFPPELVQRLPATREAGPQLLEADIDHLVFTGSDTVGRKIAVRCAERLLPTTLELSGCDAMIVREDADIPLAAKAAWYGMTLNQGQTCIAVRRIFVPKSKLEEFQAELDKAATNRKARPIVMPGQVLQARELVADAKAKGAALLFPEAPEFRTESPASMPAIVLTNANPSMRICREATFAPVAGLLPYSDEGELRRLIDACPFALAGSIFSTDTKGAEVLARSLSPGLVVINDVIVPEAHPATPFGGRNASGWGTTQGAEGLLAMTVPQVVSLKPGKFRPYYDSANRGVDAGTERLLKGLLSWSHARTIGQRLRGLWNAVRGGMKVGKDA